MAGQGIIRQNKPDFDIKGTLLPAIFVRGPGGLNGIPKL